MCLQEVGNVHFSITDEDGNDCEINISDFLRINIL